ncbi:haloacid dehalogenase type II [Pelagibaculum spongiae]|uniref:(S)-2-haloacid dehalogenase n=1 Tax=Pelagibaculum spongiae TaxID=2080658 RepID=A0A2V1H3C7_9GAMM|nr:haloacid dehalogenase type II [Pelagibaculum spongiae]PVZ70509.1 haloacid dehalogenase type II [Pelagibaculum spongiae]
MKTTLAFDIYGTLIDTHSVVSLLRHMIDDKAVEFSQSWREKQLEYSFRRGLMKQYADFSVCTSQALDYCCEKHKCYLSDAEKKQLLDSYRELPAFSDVKQSLQVLKQKEFRLFAFSNGKADAVKALLLSAGIDHLFEGIVSADSVQTFKPDPAVYQHFLVESETSLEHCWLVSSNPFDVTGAIACGWKTAWLQRTTHAVFDPWEFQPTITVDSLQQLAETLN